MPDRVYLVSLVVSFCFLPFASAYLFLFKKQRIESGQRFSMNLDNLHANLHVI